MNEKDVPLRGKGGRPPKNDKSANCVMVRFTDVEYARFLSMYEESGVATKARFILARVFDQEFRVIKTDRETDDFVLKLSAFYGQIRAVGTNYNQVVKLLHTHFAEQKARALLYKLEKTTVELSTIGHEVLALCEEFRGKYLPE